MMLFYLPPPPILFLSEVIFCAQLLHAIWQYERDAGCPEHESQPLYGELWDSGFEGRTETEIRKYLDYGRKLYGQNWTHEFIDSV